MIQHVQALRPILEGQPVIPVLSVEHAEHAVPLARALARGGLPAVEITLRTQEALGAIARVAAEVPEAIVGAGTVLSPSQYEKAVAAGARFIVSPGASSALFAAARDHDVPWLPGAATATEMMAALEEGHTLLKFFPAEQAGGVGLLRALAAPLADVSFCPTGGIGITNAPEYLRLGNVICVGGSWVAPGDRTRAGDWDGIEALAREAAALTRESAP